jgi:hypothetical protein
VELVFRIKSLLYGERLTLEGAKKRLLAESRRQGEQLGLGMREAAHGEALQRFRKRLEAIRSLLAGDRRGLAR